LAASKSQLLSHSFLLDSNMKVLAVALLGLPYLVVAMQLPNGVEINVDDIDPEDNVDEDQFVKDFDLPEVTDPEEKARRQAALKANEALIKEENEAYSRGEKTWFDAVNEFADLPEDEFEAEKTGDQSPPDYRTYGRGLLEPTGADRVDFASEQYFAEFRRSMKTNRAATPASYDSDALGLVSEVKNQKQCGSCVAFANMAAIETCFKKATGVFGDYSEQQLVDCGYQQNGANGCNGAYTYSYIKTLADSGLDLTAEATYPYKNTDPALTCPALDHYNQGAKVSGVYYTYNGDEETLKGLVAKHGAVVTSVGASGPFQDYEGGIFAGCTSDQTDHAVTVVGYGTDSATGMDYWKVKNSWGKTWGEDGFIRLQRGVGMCGIGKTIAVAECETVAGPTDATITTEAPCNDVYSNCAALAETACYQSHISTNCPKSCGLCPGATPAASNTCYNLYSNCADLCSYGTYADKCKKACGKC